MENKTSWLWFTVPSVIAILSGLSVGSGGLLVIWLTELMGVGAETARALNLFFFTVSASAALLFHIKRRKLCLSLILLASFFSLCGTVIGTFVGNRLDPSVLRKLFGGFLVFSGAYSLFGSKKSNRATKNAKKALF